MEPFEKNIKALGLKNAELAELLSSTDAVPPALEITKSGEPTFKYGGLYFHSRYDPWREADTQIGDILSKKPDWIALFGLGYGYLLRRLVEKGCDKVIVYEPSIEILKGAFSEIDLAAAIAREKVFICNDTGSAISIMRANVSGDEDIMGYQPAPYRQLFSEEITDYMNKVRNVHSTSKIGVSTEFISRLLWVENYFSNLYSLLKYPVVDRLVDKFKGIPLVIVGAGPSLAKNASLLKDIKGKALIIAAITAYRPLIEYGVIPDFIICIEKTDLPGYFAGEGCDLKTRLLLAEIAHPNLFKRKVKGKFIFFNPYISLSVNQMPFWGVNRMFSCGGSVTTVALDMGVAFGCDPVIFIGQDLCFVDGRTHDRGSVYEGCDITMDMEKGEVHIAGVERMGDTGDTIVTKEELSIDSSILWLKGLDGKPVPSSYAWVSFHQWFEKYMVQLKNSDLPVKVINATEGGAFIKGMEHITLATAIKRHIKDERPIERILSDAESSMSPVDYKGLLGSFRQMLEDTVEISEFSGYILKEAGKVRESFKKTGLHIDLLNNVDRVKGLEKELFDKAEKVPFLWEALMACTIKLKEYLKEERDENEEEQFGRDLDATMNIYKKVEEVAEKFRPILAVAIETVETFTRDGREAAL